MNCVVDQNSASVLLSWAPDVRRASVGADSLRRPAPSRPRCVQGHSENPTCHVAVDRRNIFFLLDRETDKPTVYPVYPYYFLTDFLTDDHMTVTSPIDESLIRWCHSTNRWCHYFWLKALSVFFSTMYDNHIGIVVLWTEKQILSLSDCWAWWRKLYILVNYWQTVDWINVLIISP